MSAAATAALWSRFAGGLRGFLARRVPAGVDPDDLLQEVFLRIHQHLPELRETERIDAWMYRIARNAITDAMRRPARIDADADAEVAADVSTDDDASGPIGVELAPCLAAMIAELDEPYRSAIELTELGGLTQAEAARRAGISLSGMKSRVQRGRRQLEERLRGCCRIELDRRGGIAVAEPRAPDLACVPCGTRCRDDA
jgi:RNA polymerase sigma-70 factor, ECF subfamily